MHTITLGEAIYWFGVALVTVTSAARITRLVTFDAFPPAARIRIIWDRLTNDGEWALLVHCGYCFSFWATLGVVFWGYVANWDTAWWLTNTVFGGSYLAAIVMANDGDE